MVSLYYYKEEFQPLLNGAGESVPGNSGMDGAPLDEAIKHANPHHFIRGAQSSLPVDAGGNPWNGSWVYSHGNLIGDMLNNVVLESTGVLGFHNIQFNFRLDKTRIAEIFNGSTPSRNDGELAVTQPPAGFPVPQLPEMANEHSPGLADMFC